MQKIKTASLEYETQKFLLLVLASNGWRNWRAVCPHIFIEPDEPYRTIVVTSEILLAAQKWLKFASELSVPSGLEMVSDPDRDDVDESPENLLCLPANFFSPLTGDKAQLIILYFPLRLFEGAA